jgi:hypothetical protein
MKNLAKSCSLCKANFDAWVGSLDLESETDRSMKKAYGNFCPVCRQRKGKTKKR